MVQFFARNRGGLPPPPLTTPPPTTGGTQATTTQNAPPQGALQGLAPTTTGTVATRQTPRPRINLFGRSGAAQTQAQPQTPPVLPDIATAMTQAHGAHGQVAARVDGEAAANAALGKRQQSIQDLQQRGTAATTAATAEATLRQNEQTAAHTLAGLTSAALPGLQTAVDGHQTALDTALAQAPGLDAAVRNAQNNPALAAARTTLENAQRALQREQNSPPDPTPPAQPAAPGGPPPGPTRDQRIAAATAARDAADAVFQPLSQAVTTAQTQRDQNNTAIGAHRTQLATAQANQRTGIAADDAAQQRLTAANAAVTRLNTASATLTTLTAANSPQQTALQAHATAAQAAVPDAAAATQAHRTLAQSTAEAAERTRTAATDRDALTKQQAISTAADNAHAQADARLQNGGDLHTHHQNCEQAVTAAQNAMPQPVPGSPPPPNSRALQQALNDRTLSQTALNTQAGVVGQLLTEANTQRTALIARQQAVAASGPLETAANLQRDQHRTAADNADAAAQTSAGARDALKPAADQAQHQIEHAIDALCEEIRPKPAPPHPDERTRVGVAKDNLLSRPLAAVERRMAPVKVDFALGSITGSTSGTAPTKFNNGVPPARTPTDTVLSDGALKRVDAHVKVAAGGAANLLTDASIRTKRPAETPAAFGKAEAFSSEVGRMFASGTHATESTPLGTTLAQALLNHPNPDPAGRPDGHPLRHEQALLIATTLRTVTDDPVVAAHVYNALWNGGGGVTPSGTVPRAPAQSPLAGVTMAPAGPEVPRLANEARRALAATSGGMQALMDLQGLSLPPAAPMPAALGPTPTPAAQAAHATALTAFQTRQHAERAVEHYKLGLRAESALLAQGLQVGGNQTQADFRTAITTPPAGATAAKQAEHAKLVDPARLGTGNQRRGTMRRGDPEPRSTLPAQAFLYAADNVNRAQGTPEVNTAMKPAYVALRNGFTESGSGTDFHLMAKRLHKFCRYIDLACKTQVAGPGVSNSLRTQIDAVLHPGDSMRRMVGKDKTPLKTLMQAGPLGSEIGTVPGEHAKRLKGALDRSKTLLMNDVRANAGAMTVDQRTDAVMRLAMMDAWHAKVPPGADPLIDLTQGLRLSKAEIEAAVTRVNHEISNPPPAPGAAAPPPVAPPVLTQRLIDTAVAAQADKTLLPGTLNDWVEAGQLSASGAPGTMPQATPTATAAQISTAVETLQTDLKVLRGKAAMDSELDQLQRDFNAATPQARQDILRKVLVTVVAGGDMTDYSDGRKFGLGGMFGYGVASVDGIGGLTTGVTPVGEFNVDHSRTAVLKAGVASNTGVIFLGNETKVTEMLGGGVRVGAQVGQLGGNVQAMARLGGAHLFSKGLMIRTNKSGVEHQELTASLTPAQSAAMRAPEGSWKRMSEKTVDSIFELAAQNGPGGPGNAPARPANGGEMWAQMVGKVGDYRDISFGWNEGKSHQVNGSLSADGSGSGKLGKGFGASGTAGVALRHTFMNRSKAKDEAGATQTVQAGSGSRTSLGATASVGVSHPTIKRDNQPDVGVFARHKVGVETELVIQAKNGFVRITTEDGKVKPNISYKHREYAVQDDFIKLVNKESGEWQARLGQRGPDGVLRGGDEALKGFVQQMVNLPPGNNRLFIERKCLTPEAAETINACLDRIKALERPPAPGAPADAGAAAQVKDLHKQIAAHVEAEASWQPFRLFVNESNQRAKDASAATGEFRATPKSAADKEAGPQGMAEKLLAGGKITIGGKINTAHGGRDLITIDAQPVRV
ncbi:hypothetical protein [Roseateles sp. L2-2]|uniref:hypothetical protein n=1 Tax=Roseateles sp. L2-2 TaxID=3422597 RepID=UPI003D36F2D1